MNGRRFAERGRFFRHIGIANLTILSMLERIFSPQSPCDCNVVHWESKLRRPRFHYRHSAVPRSFQLHGLLKPPAGKVAGVAQPVGYLISHEINDSSIVVNRLLKDGDQVFWLKEPVSVNGRKQGPGTIYVPASAKTRAILDRGAATLGVSSEGVAARPGGEALQLKPARIGLWDQYGGLMPSGWLRWMLEQYEFQFEVVYPQALDAGNLVGRLDVIVFPDGAISRGGRYDTGSQPKPEDIPAEYRNRLGGFTAEKTLPQLKAFADAGGTIIAMGSSSRMGMLLGLPMSDGLTETVDGRDRPLPGTKFYVPGSVLRASIDNTSPMAHGMPSEVDIYFENSQAFRLAADASLNGMQRGAWFSNATPLRSGWAWGQAYLEGKAEAVVSPLGQGKVFLIGFKATFRGQPHGTFKLLFNSIYFGPAKSSSAGAAVQ